MHSILRNQDKGVFYKKDIITEMSKEMGIPEKELEELININISYIKKSIVEKEILLVSLPNLTKLRFNLKIGMSSMHYHRESKIHKKKYDSLCKKVKLLSSYYSPSLINFNKPLFERLYRKIKKRKPRAVYETMYNMWADIEKENHRILKEIK